MTPHRFVVLATRARGFDSLDEARPFALANYPCTIMERVRDDAGGSVLVEVARHDFLWDAQRGEWRIMLA